MISQLIKNYHKILNVALGKEPADLVIKEGNLVNVYTGEIYEADVAVKEKFIVKVGKVGKCIGKNTKIINAKGKYLLPGFIDGHIHIESSMLSIPRFAEAVLPHGTTAVATDFHEIGIILGIKGIRFMLDVAKQTPLKVFLMVPSHIPFMPGLETTGFKFVLRDIEEALTWEESVALSEVVSVQLLSLHETLLKGVELAKSKSKLVEGHAPALRGDVLQAFASAGIQSDHESTSLEEALEKLRLGIELMIREGSVSQDLHEVIKVVTKNHVDTCKIMLVSDDMSCVDLVKFGHMNYKIKKAIEEGVDPIKAIQMVTINVAKHFRVDEIVGSITPGRLADIVVVNNLRELDIEKVVANGKLVVVNGKIVTEIPKPQYPEKYVRTLNVKRKLREEDFKIKVPISSGKAEVRVIGVKDGTLLKDGLVEELPIVNGEVQINFEKDILKISVIERHKATGNIGLGFIKGFNLKKGAIASTVAHDHHNITVVSTNDRDAALAANTLIDINGGLAVVAEGKVLGTLELPIAGILSDKPVHEVKEKLEILHSLSRKLGCNLRDPFMHLSFVTLTAIPAYGISDKGLIDVINAKIVSPIISTFQT